MKIIFIIPDYGSFIHFLSGITLRLLKKGHSVKLITGRNKAVQISEKYDFSSFELFEVAHINFPRSFRLISIIKGLLALIKLLKNTSGSSNIIHAHFTASILLTFLASIFLKKKGRTISTFHGLNYSVEKNPVKKFVFSLIEIIPAKWYDRVEVLNDLDFISLRPYIDKNKLIKIPTFGLGCNLRVFNPKRFNKSDRVNLKKQFGIPKEAFVLLYVGRYVHFKGFHLVVRYILNTNSNVYLLTVGGFDRVHWSGLGSKEQIDLKCHSRVINVGFSSNVEKYYSIADLFVFPSVKEGLPIVLLESIAMELPFLTSNSRGCIEVADLIGAPTIADQKQELFNQSLNRIIENDSIRATMKSKSIEVRELVDSMNYISYAMRTYTSLLNLNSSRE